MLKSFLNHAITIGDIFVVASIAAVLALLFVAFAITAVNQGWVD